MYESRTRIALAIIFCILMAILTFRVAFTSAASDCPPGTYNINTKDEPICKAEPTGCPYGDSIPLDSPKCAPSPEEKAMQKKTQKSSKPVDKPVETVHKCE